jgi:hypothetical protein
MKFERTLENLRSRIQFSQARDFLSSEDISPAIGWKATIAALLNMKPPVDTAIVSTLNQALIDSYVAGRKSISIYEIDSDKIKSIRIALSATQISKNAFQSSFPYPIVDVNAAGLPSVGAWLPTAVINRPNGVALLLSAIRDYEVREPIDYSSLPQSARDLLDEYEQVVGLAKKRSQVFDALWIPSKGNRIASLVDLPEGVNKSFARLGHAAIRSYVTDTFKIALKPIDLFDAVGGLYAAANEGSVVELGFATDGSGVKSAKMRRDNSCVRKDIFQIGGEAAVHNKIYPYRIAVRWKVKKSKKFTVEPELIFEGHARMLSMTSEKLTQATLARLWDTKDLEFVFNKINAHT